MVEGNDLPRVHEQPRGRKLRVEATRRRRERQARAKSRCGYDGARASFGGLLVAELLGLVAEACPRKGRGMPVRVDPARWRPLARGRGRRRRRGRRAGRRRRRRRL